VDSTNCTVVVDDLNIQVEASREGSEDKRLQLKEWRG